LALVRGERQLNAGVVDLTAYEQAARLDPELDAAQQRLDHLSGSAQQRELVRRRWAAFAGLAVLLAMLLLLLRHPTLPEDEADVSG